MNYSSIPYRVNIPDRKYITRCAFQARLSTDSLSASNSVSVVPTTLSFILLGLLNTQCIAEEMYCVIVVGGEEQGTMMLDPRRFSWVQPLQWSFAYIILKFCQRCNLSRGTGRHPDFRIKIRVQVLVCSIIYGKTKFCSKLKYVDETPCIVPRH